MTNGEPAVSDDPPDTPATHESPPRGPDMSQRALTLKEAAALLHVSYWTVHAHRESLGFFKVGGAWRVWPEVLREATGRGASARPVQNEQEIEPCPSKSVKGRPSTTSISARQAASELDKLLAQPTGKKRRNTTTS
ncbi:Excisionase family DNA binding protein [Paraburkholderia sacchari]